MGFETRRVVVAVEGAEYIVYDVPTVNSIFVIFRVNLEIQNGQILSLIFNLFSFQQIRLCTL